MIKLSPIHTYRATTITLKIYYLNWLYSFCHWFIIPFRLNFAFMSIIAGFYLIFKDKMAGFAIC